jgi:hypothetical protein
MKMSYDEYVNAKKEAEEFKRLYKRSKIVVDEVTIGMSSDTDDDHSGRYGMEITGHGFKQIAERLEELATDHVHIYKDVFVKDDPFDMLLIPTNLKMFVFNILREAERLGDKWRSKSSAKGGIEYVYTMEIKKWCKGKNRCTFTCIIEDNNIKTGYFDYGNK